MTPMTDSEALAVLDSIIEFRPEWVNSLEQIEQARAHIAEALRDAERYRRLRDSRACSLSISHNDHHNMYQSVAATFEGNDQYYSDVSDDERAAMIAADAIWTVHVYPNTPVGFNVYHGATLDVAIDAAIGESL